MRYLLGLRAGALISVTLVSFALSRCGPGQSGNDTEPSTQETSTAAEAPTSTQASPSVVSLPPPKGHGPKPKAPNITKDLAIQAGDLDAFVSKWRRGLPLAHGSQRFPEVTAVRVTNKGAYTVGGFAIAIRFLDGNGKRLKTEYVEVGRYEGVPGESERTFSVHIGGPADAKSVDAEILSDSTIDREQENMRMLQEDLAKNGESRNP